MRHAAIKRSGKHLLKTVQTADRPTYTEEDYTDFPHTGPDTLAGRYLRRFWQPVFTGRDLHPGRAVPVRVLGQDFTLYRGESGAAYLVAPRCAHRGTLLTSGTIEGEEIRCFYHGWKYDGVGQCTEQPAESPSFAHKVCIASYPVREYLGLVFAYLGGGTPPEFPLYPEVEGEGATASFVADRPCNYFQNVENGVDEVHLAFVHRQSTFSKAGLNWDIPKIEAEETSYGIVQYGTRSNGVRRVSHFLMPNALMFQAGTDPAHPFDMLLWRVPIDDHSHKNVVVMHTRAQGERLNAFWREIAEVGHQLLSSPPHVLAQRVLTGQLRVQDLPDRPDMILVQDDIALCGQGVIQDRSQERLGKSDLGIILLRRMWARELEALATGGSLKHWQRPATLQTTYGV